MNDGLRVETTTRRTLPDGEEHFRVVTAANDPLAVVVVRIIVIITRQRMEATHTVCIDDDKVKAAVATRSGDVTGLWSVCLTYIVGHLICSREGVYSCKGVLVIYPLWFCW